MASSTLEQVIAEVKALSVEEQKQLQETLHRLLTSSPTESQEQELARVLLQAGLVAELRPRGIDAQAYRQYKPVRVKGKPLSETIIEERR